MPRMNTVLKASSQKAKVKRYNILIAYSRQVFYESLSPSPETMRGI